MSEPRKVKTYQLIPTADAANASLMEAKGLEKLGTVFDVVEGTLTFTVNTPEPGTARIPGYSIVEFEAMVTDKVTE